MESVAIVGGGPAGATAAERLLTSGSDEAGGVPKVTVFEEKPGWEKPCGGGLTAKAVRRYPYLMAASCPHTHVQQAELVAAGGEAVRFKLRAPLLVYSRSELNELLLSRAERAGASVIRDRILGFERRGSTWHLRGRDGVYEAAYLIVAAGARSGLRKLLAPGLAAHDFLLTFGYFAPSAGTLLRVQFFRDFEGYAWAFPRPDHLSLGIAGKMGETDMKSLRERLHEFMDRFGYSGKQSPVFAHLLPALSAESWRGLHLTGDGWAMAGDAAGLVDPLTGEGIYFAMRSADLVASAILTNRLDEYPSRVWREFARFHQIGARMSRRFYKTEFCGKPVTERMVEFCSRSSAFMNLLQDLFEGTQGYGGLPKRVYRTLAKGAIEMAAGAVKDRLSLDSTV
ncbi:MAG: NAD(P)/FAD-dependent oxidoreductase [Terriglobia bacterium]